MAQSLLCLMKLQYTRQLFICGGTKSMIFSLNLSNHVFSPASQSICIISDLCCILTQCICAQPYHHESLSLEFSILADAVGRLLLDLSQQIQHFQDLITHQLLLPIGQSLRRILIMKEKNLFPFYSMELRVKAHSQLQLQKCNARGHDSRTIR